jgi:hypothetical protein
MAQDKKLHLILGFALALVSFLIVFVAWWVGPGYAVAFGCFVGALGVEHYQDVRNEGVPSWADARYSAAPGVVLGLGYELARSL